MNAFTEEEKNLIAEYKIKIENAGYKLDHIAKCNEGIAFCLVPIILSTENNNT